MAYKKSLLHKRLAELRTEKGWTRQQLADKLELTRQTCGNYENRSRLPDADIIIRMCSVFGVSADYLLGLSDTRKPEFAEIAGTTGLTEASILYLTHTAGGKVSLVNHLMEEEPGISPTMMTLLELGQNEDCEYLNDPDYIDAQYQAHLEYLEWEKRMSNTPILEHLANDWAEKEYLDSLTDEDYAEMEKAQVEKAMAEMTLRKEYTAQPDMVPKGAYYEETSQRSMQEEWAFKEAETKKSKLLSAIAQYVAYSSGCTIETSMWSEKMTEQHSISLGTGNGTSIVFPSTQGDELLEFMLLQKVINALKLFKQNYNKRTN